MRSCGTTAAATTPLITSMSYDPEGKQLPLGPQRVGAAHVATADPTYIDTATQTTDDQAAHQ